MKAMLLMGHGGPELMKFGEADDPKAGPRPTGNYIEALAGGNEAEVISHLYWDRGWFTGINDPCDKTGIKSIHVAAEKGHAHLVQLLIDRGADVDNPGEWGYNQRPLHVAANQGHLAVVAILLARRANPNAMGRGGTPLDVAEAAGKTEVANLLKEFGARRASELPAHGAKGDER